MVKRYILVGCLWCILFIQPSILSAQQFPLYSQFRENLGLINAAAYNQDFINFSESNYRISAGATFREQYALPESPITWTAHFESFLNPYRKKREDPSLLLGIYAVRDDFDPVINKGGWIKLAYIIRTADTDDKLSIGWNIGRTSLTINPDINFKNPNDIVIQEGLMHDEGLINGEWSTNFGVFGQKKIDILQIYGGFSINRPITNFKKDSDLIDYRLNTPSQYNILVGAKQGTNQTSFLEFSSWLKKVKAIPWNYDAVIRYHFESKAWLGLGYNSSGLLTIDSGVYYKYKNFQKKSPTLNKPKGFFKLGFSCNLGINQKWKQFKDEFNTTIFPKPATIEINLTYLWGNISAQ